MLAVLTASRRDAPGLSVPRLIGRSSAVAAMKGAQSVLMLLALAVAARWLGASAYGTLATVLAGAGLLAAGAQLGLPQHLLRRVAALERAGDPDGLSRLFSASITSVLIATAGLVGLACLAGGLGWHALALGAVAAGPLALLRVLGAWLQARNRIVAGQAADALLRPGGLVLAFGGAALVAVPAAGITAAWLVVAVLVAAAAVAVWQVGRLDRPVARDAVRAKRPAWAGSAPLTGLALLHAVMANADVLMLGTLASPDAAGAYHAASRVALTLGLAMAAVGSVTGPPLAHAAANGDAGEQRRIAVTSARLLAIPAALALPVVAAVAEPALALLGEGFAAGAPALIGLWIGQLVNLGCGPVAVLLNLHDRARATVKGVALGAVANLGLNALLIPPFGATGAAVATAASTAVWNVTLAVAVRRGLGIDATVLGRAPRGAAA